jgi:peptidoglycan/xylan/chitin deacetylase (PgdA/CDA1 family)
MREKDAVHLARNYWNITNHHSKWLPVFGICLIIADILLPMSVSGKILSALYRKYNYCRVDLSTLAGTGRSFYRNARGARMLVYHGLCLQEHTRFNTIFLLKQTFERHLQYFQRYFNLVCLEDYYQQKFRDDRFNICITFDDGFANNFNYVLPLLEKYQAPAAFFITGIREAGYDILWNDFMSILHKYGPATLHFKGRQFHKKHGRYLAADGHSLLALLQAGGFDDKAALMHSLYPLVPFREKDISPDYWLQMTPEQIAVLAASPFATIGCHGYYHNDLAKIPLADAATEMERSRKYLEQISGRPLKAIAFPYGSYSPGVVAAAKNAGFDRLLALDFLSPADHADPSMRERFTINPFISVHNQLHAIINGKYT